MMFALPWRRPDISLRYKNAVRITADDKAVASAAEEKPILVKRLMMEV